MTAPTQTQTQAERDRAVLAAILNAVATPAHNAAVLAAGVDLLEYTGAMERGLGMGL